MWLLFSFIAIVAAIKEDFAFIRNKCSCDYADAGPNFLPNDTIWVKEDNFTRMPYQCPRTHLRNKFAVMKYLVEVEEEVRRNCNTADNCRRLGRRRNHDKVIATPKFDYIVVGSGAAGAVIAGRLASHFADYNKTVLLLEAGDVDPVLSRVPAFYKYFRFHNDTDWNFRTVAQKEYCKMSYGKCKLNHGRTFGGTTIFNDMIYQRGHRDDCNAWYKSFGRRFRSCRDLEPYYLKFENSLDTKLDDYTSVHGMFGPMPVQKFAHRTPLIDRLIDAAVKIGSVHLEDMLDPRFLTGGLGVAHSFQGNGQRFTPARVYIHPRSTNLLLVLRAQVTKVLFKEKRAYAVEYALYENWNDTRTVEAVEEIILSAGVFNTPKILMLSGIGPQKELEKLNITVLLNLPIGEKVKFHYGFRMRYALGYHADHLRVVNWYDNGVIWGVWYYLWENSMVYLRPTEYWKKYYWIDLLDDDNLDQYLDTGTGALSSNGLAQLVGMITTNLTKDQTKPDVQLIFEGMQADCSRTKKQNLTWPFKNYYPTKAGNRVFNSTKYRIINKTTKYWAYYHLGKRLRVNADLAAVASRHIDIYINLLNPRSTGSMTLRSTNPGDPPVIYPNFFEDTEDMAMLFQAAKYVDKLMLSPALSDLKFEMPVDYFRLCGFTEYYYGYKFKNWHTPDGYHFSLYYRDINITLIRCLARQYTVAKYHQQGTVPIGTVISPSYEVKGVTGLRVVDGSIIPGPLSGSPQGTIMMFAEHLAEILAKEIKSPNLDMIQRGDIPFNFDPQTETYDEAIGVTPEKVY